MKYWRDTEEKSQQSLEMLRDLLPNLEDISRLNNNSKDKIVNADSF